MWGGSLIKGGSCPCLMAGVSEVLAALRTLSQVQVSGILLASASTIASSHTQISTNVPILNSAALYGATVKADNTATGILASEWAASIGWSAGFGSWDSNFVKTFSPSSYNLSRAAGNARQLHTLAGVLAGRIPNGLNTSCIRQWLSLNLSFVGGGGYASAGTSYALYENTRTYWRTTPSMPVCNDGATPPPTGGGSVLLTTAQYEATLSAAGGGGVVGLARRFRF